jgi:hypothetical protein
LNNRQITTSAIEALESVTAYKEDLMGFAIESDEKQLQLSRE